MQSRGTTLILTGDVRRTFDSMAGNMGLWYATSKRPPDPRFDAAG
jgi:hypothetical protein